MTIVEGITIAPRTQTSKAFSIVFSVAKGVDPFVDGDKGAQSHSVSTRRKQTHIDVSPRCAMMDKIVAAVVCPMYDELCKSAKSTSSAARVDQNDNNDPPNPIGRA